MDLIREIRQAARQLVSVPSFTIPAVLLLGLGLGATIAMFSVVHAVLLRPMVPEQDRVVVLFPRDASGRPSVPGNLASGVSRLAGRRHLVPGARGVQRGKQHSNPWCSKTAAPSTSAVASVTPTLLRRRGSETSTRARLRKRRRAAATPSPSLVLGHGLWREAFGEDPAVLGTTHLASALASTTSTPSSG